MVTDRLKYFREPGCTWSRRFGEREGWEKEKKNQTGFFPGTLSARGSTHFKFGLDHGTGATRVQRVERVPYAIGDVLQQRSHCRWREFGTEHAPYRGSRWAHVGPRVETDGVRDERTCENGRARAEEGGWLKSRCPRPKWRFTVAAAVTRRERATRNRARVNWSDACTTTRATPTGGALLGSWGLSRAMKPIPTPR